MKYQIIFKAKKAIELLSKLNKSEFFGLLNEEELYYINTNVAIRAIEMLNYKFTYEECDPLPNDYSYERIFDTNQATRDFWCIFTHDFYSGHNPFYYKSWNCAQDQWASAGSNNFEFETYKICQICLSMGEKMEFDRACDNDDYDTQERLEDLAQDRYTSSIELIGKAFYSILTSLDLLTVKEITE